MGEPTILVLDTNSAGNGTRAMRHAHERGLRSHLLCAQPDEYATHRVDPREVADQVTHVDTYDVVKMLRVIDQRRTDYVAVLAFDELRIVQAALLAQQLGLPHHPSPAPLMRVRFKDLMRAALQHTRWAVSHTVIDLGSTRSPIGYPCVVKPVDEASGVAVNVCRDDADYFHAVAELSTVAGQPNSRGYRLLDNVGLVEQFLPGPEYSAELVWSHVRQAWHLLGITAKAHTHPNTDVGHFASEYSNIFPYPFNPEQIEQLHTEITGCLGALGLKYGTLHLQFRLDESRFQLIEVNPRPPGDRTDELVELALGVGMVELHLAALLGEADVLLHRLQHRCYAGIGFAHACRNGTVTGIHIDPDPYRDRSRHVELRCVATPHPTVARRCNGSRIGHALVTGHSPDDVAQQLMRHLARIHPQYAPEDRSEETVR